MEPAFEGEEKARMETKNGSAKGKPFYRNVDDTLEAVGITRRQLGYWRKQGLFSPELGPTSKFFTEDDTTQLRFLKSLIEDLGLSVATVQRLVSPESYWTNEESIELWGPSVGPAHHHTFIDIKKQRLVMPADAMSALVADAMVGKNEFRVMHLLEPTLLITLQKAWMHSRNVGVYEAHVKSLHDLLEHIDLVSRFRIDRDGEASFWPKLETDPVLSDELVEKLATKKKTLSR